MREILQSETMTSNVSSLLGDTFVCDSDFDCRNDGICIYDVGITPSESRPVASHCKCEAGFMGLYCENMCTHKCLNGGQCVHMKDEITNIATATVICACPTGFSGFFCQIDDVLAAKNSENSGSTDEKKRQSTASPILIVLSCFIGIALFVTYRRRRIRNRERTIWNSGILTNPKYSYEQRSAMARLAALGTATSTSLSVLHDDTVYVDDVSRDQVGSKQQNNTSFT